MIESNHAKPSLFRLLLVNAVTDTPIILIHQPAQIRGVLRYRAFLHAMQRQAYFIPASLPPSVHPPGQ